MSVEVSIVVETYSHGEGSGLERLGRAVEEAARMASEHRRAEVLVCDVGGDARVAELLEGREIRRIDAVGLSYDEAKMRAAAEALGEFVLYLDGDCIPGENWIESHLAVLRAAPVSSGFTRYDEDGYLSALSSVMDFGFLLPRRDRELSCYAFNNAGFRRGVFADVPIPDGPMRCRCYAHAQLLAGRGIPVRMAAEARAEHEPTPFFRERFRQGFDLVAACWINRDLPERRWLRLGPLGAPVFYARAVAFDWIRVLRGGRDLGLSRRKAVLSLPLFPLLRLVDLAGAAYALTRGSRATFWRGQEAG